MAMETAVEDGIPQRLSPDNLALFNSADSTVVDTEEADDIRSPTRAVSEITVAEMEQMSKTRGSFKKPERWMILLGCLLTMCAGIVNVGSFLVLGSLVSHMTGTTSKVAMHLEGIRVSVFDEMPDHVINPLLEQTREEHISECLGGLIIGVSFIFGAFLCGLVISKNTLHFGGNSFYGVALLMNSVLLSCCTLAKPHHTLYAACFAACACGLQNAMCTIHLGAVVRTTHVTGTCTDIGSTSGRIAVSYIKAAWRRRSLTPVERTEVEVDSEKLAVLVPLLFSFMIGSYMGAFWFDELGHFIFLIPAFIHFVLGTLYTFFRENLVRVFNKKPEDKISDAIKRSVTNFSRHITPNDSWSRQQTPIDPFSRQVSNPDERSIPVDRRELRLEP